MSSCSGKKSVSTSLGVKAGFLGNGYFSGGVMVWGKGPNGEDLAVAFADDNVVKNISLPQGDWSFYSIGWYGAGVLESTVKCGQVDQKIEGQESSVSITMDDSTCSNGFFSDPSYMTGDSFNPLKFIVCDDVTGKTQGQNCDGGGTKGSAASFKLKFNEVSPDGSLNGALSSTCLDEATIPSSETSTTFNIPVGILGESFFDFSIETFSQSSCLGNQLDFEFSNGLINGSGSNLIYTSGSLTEVFLQSPLQGPIITSYTLSPAVYPFNTVIASNLPTNIGGPATAYTVAPALPTGLALNAATGEISGTPSVVVGLTTYTITATGLAGVDTYDIDITILEDPPVFISYSSNNDTYLAGQAIATNSPTLTGGTVASFSIAPALPTGLSFNTITGNITGTPSAYTADQSYTITASNSGGTDTISVNIEVLNPASISVDYGTDYDFGDVPIATGSDSIIITLTNAANSAAATGISITGLGGDFDFLGVGGSPGTGGDCGASLAASASCTYVIEVTPSGTGALTSNFDINYNNGVAADIENFTFNANGVLPAVLSISDGPTYDYGLQATSTVTSKTFTISNSGGYQATSMNGSGLVTPFNFSGGSYPGGGTCGTTLGAGASCTIIVDYSPVSTGVSSDTINIGYDDGTGLGSTTRNIQGTGGNPAAITFDYGATFDFGVLEVLPTATLNMVNIWDASTNSPNLVNGTGTLGNYYVVSNSGQTTFGSFDYYFSAGDIVIYDGNAWVGFFDLTLNNYTFTITNNGDLPATSLTINTPALPFYVTGGTCGTTLAAGSSCDIDVEVRPTQVSKFINTLDVDYNTGVSTTTESITLEAKGGSIIDAAASKNSRCVAFNNGQVKCWGNNSAGQLGLELIGTNSKGDNPSEMGANLPFVDLGTGFNVAELTGGENFFCARSTQGDIKCWGENIYGQLGLGDTANRGINSGDMGNSLPIVNLGGARKALKISAGSSHICALSTDDSFQCWGDNQYGQIGQGATPNLTSPPSPLTLPIGRTVVDFSLASNHTCVILDNDDVFCWGLGSSGQLGAEATANLGISGPTLPNSIAPIDLGTVSTPYEIFAGPANTTCLIYFNDNLKCWGDGLDGKLGRGNTINAGHANNSMADNLAFIDLGTGLTSFGITQTYDSEVCTLLDTDEIKCWGKGLYGGLGQEVNTNIGNAGGQMGDALPEVDLGTGELVYQLMKGGTCVITYDDELKCWGRNNSGQLGRGNVTDVGFNTNDMGDNLPIVELR